MLLDTTQPFLAVESRSRQYNVNSSAMIKTLGEIVHGGLVTMGDDN
jgi:hypothetical protein